MAHEFFPSGVIVVPVGSRVTCSPPPSDTDDDYLVLTNNKKATIDALKGLGFEHSADPEKVKEYEAMGKTSQYSFTSMWFGDVNYIITDNQFFFERFLTATHVCKTLNLLRKEDRVMVFEAVRGGSFTKAVLPDWEPEYKNWYDHKRSGARLASGLFEELKVNVMSNTGSLPF